MSERMNREMKRERPVENHEAERKLINESSVLYT